MTYQGAAAGAGWYPDPAARAQMRYWDGGGWTAHVSNGGIAAADDLGPGLAGYPPPFGAAPPAYGPPASASQGYPPQPYGPPGYGPPAYGPPAYGYAPVPFPGQKSKLTAGLLGIFLGGFGVHRFYLGFTTIGVIQILVTIFTLGIGSLWGFIEGILILTGSIHLDAQGYELGP